jgi:hypothetical protein
VSLVLCFLTQSALRFRKVRRGVHLFLCVLRETIVSLVLCFLTQRALRLRKVRRGIHLFLCVLRETFVSLVLCFLTQSALRFRKVRRGVHLFLCVLRETFVSFALSCFSSEINIKKTSLSLYERKTCLCYRVRVGNALHFSIFPRFLFLHCSISGVSKH